MAQNHHTADWRYACSFKTSDELGVRLKQIMLRLGFNDRTDVHGVGDGAAWIAEQGEKLAGSRYMHLIDLYHLCEYFAGAVCAWEAEPREETKRIKKMAEDGKIGQVIEELKQKQQEYPYHQGLKGCIQYIENRPGQFNYKRAKEKDLPLGSGKVESTHRSLMQKRLKKPGAWWLRENAARIADLRTLRANGGWEGLGQDQSKIIPLQRVG